MLDKSAKILIVDDFEVVRHMLKTTLEVIGFISIDAAEVVFTDWYMPNLTCKNESGLRKNPIEFIVKPFSQEVLRKKIEKLNKRISGAKS